jgi:hypothetical protein
MLSLTGVEDLPKLGQQPAHTKASEKLDAAIEDPSRSASKVKEQLDKAKAGDYVLSS